MIVNKSLKALIYGYVLFRVNGKYYFTYNAALSARKAIAEGPLLFDGWNIWKSPFFIGWIGFFERMPLITVYNPSAAQGADCSSLSPTEWTAYAEK